MGYRMHHLYKSARRYKALQKRRSDSPHVPLGQRMEAQQESQELTRVVQGALSLFSEVDVRVIIGVHDRLLEEAEGASTPLSREEIDQRIVSLVREEVLSTAPEALYDPSWVPEESIDSQQTQIVEDLTDAHLLDAGERPRDYVPREVTPEEAATLPVEKWLQATVDTVLRDWPENQRRALAALDTEVVASLRADGVDPMALSDEEFVELASRWPEMRHRAMNKRADAGLLTVMDVGPSRAVEGFQKLRRAGYRLFPHEERVLWSGETTYPATRSAD
eukprot:NODE_2633_length_890_cov_66.356718_g2169_i0.p2 GENE.NODE_2633_length_890_cov_66.356718_g2169_i0~~NODE_2633_length_890_cov_66.356718_g2169_i0.p2  ORF type:complete len:285 (+),score=91.01 NODE_2633_length_890_cov_66.356718_g2169_i0:27-857(+)